MTSQAFDFSDFFFPVDCLFKSLNEGEEVDVSSEGCCGGSFDRSVHRRLAGMRWAIWARLHGQTRLIRLVAARSSFGRARSMRSSRDIFPGQVGVNETQSAKAGGSGTESIEAGYENIPVCEPQYIGLFTRRLIKQSDLPVDFT